jgi:asparagine synthase (glutamine-hydrolysing)
MMAADLEHYLVDDILAKVDTASMAVSLELRNPILDHRVVDFAWSLPRSYKLAPSGDRGKLLLRKVLYRHVPRELIERPKIGFGIPLGAWLRGPLRSWADDLFHSKTLEHDGLIIPSVARAVWKGHLNGQEKPRQVWTLLVYLHWRQR